MTRNDDLLRLILAAHAVTRIAALETKNETPAAQWRTLKLLRENGPQRVGDLATLSRISQPGMTRLVGQLAEAGLVARTPDEQDARVLVIALTAAGERALDEWLTTLGDALMPHFSGLEADAWAAITAAAGVLERATRVETVRS